MAAAARAGGDLPDWARPDLPPDERICRSETCGSECFRVFTCTAADTLAGRVMRVSRAAGAIRQAGECGWVRSDLAGSGGIVEFFAAIAPADARAVLEAVRTRVRPREIVRRIDAAAHPNGRAERPVDTGDRGVVAVSLGRDGDTGGRELLVHVTPEGAFVETRGIRTH